MTTKKSFVSEDENSTTNLVAIHLANIAANGMKILEVKSYPINDKLGNKLKRHNFNAFTLKEVTVFHFDSTKKEGYLTINNGELDLPLANLKLNEEGPWYFTDKEEAVAKVKRMNEVELAAIQELKDELDASVEYMRNLVENDRF